MNICYRNISGTTFMKTYNSQQKDGHTKEYFTDGKLSGVYNLKEGKKHGKCKFWYRNGQLKAEG
jgi:antitoxin component YwqK of YwqJK toxin-antitoxin module